MMKKWTAIGLALLMGAAAWMPVSAETAGEAAEAYTTVRRDYAVWPGIYKYDDGNQGLYFFITEAGETKLRGAYIYAESGDEIRYGVGQIDWDKDSADPAVAQELFQSQTSYVYYRLGGNGVFADYPQGWWPDRYYAYVGPIEEAYTISHPQIQEVLDRITAGTQETQQTAAAAAAVDLTAYSGNNWVWHASEGDMQAWLDVREISGSTMLAGISIYRLMGDDLTILGQDGIFYVSSSSGNFNGTAEFGADSITFHFDDAVIYSDQRMSQMLGTTDLSFYRE